MAEMYTDEDYIKEVAPNTQNVECDRKPIHSNSKQNKFVGWVFNPSDSVESAVQTINVGESNITVYAKFTEKECGLTINHQEGNDTLEVEFIKELDSVNVDYICNGTYDTENSVIDIHNSEGNMNIRGIGDDFELKIHFNNSDDLYSTENEFILYDSNGWNDDFNLMTKKYNICVDGVEFYCEPIVENNTGTTSLEMFLFGVDTDSYFSFGKKIEGRNVGYIQPFIISFNTCQSMFALVKKNNTGGINKEGMAISEIDDYGMLLMTPDSFDRFGRGESSNVTISTVNDENVKVLIKKDKRLDEDQRILLRNCFVNKAFRIPCDGFSGKIQIKQYPMTFDSEIFNRDVDLFFATNNGEDFSMNMIRGNTISEDGFSGQIISFENSNIDYTFEYNVSSNETCEYKHYMVVFSNVADNSIARLTYGGNCMSRESSVLHLIQEPKVKNRIYYSTHTPYFRESSNIIDSRKFDDNYNETGENRYAYNYFFETCDSKILTEDEFTLYKNTDLIWFVAIPDDEFSEFDYTFTAYDSRDNVVVLQWPIAYTWGERKYKLYTMSSISYVKLNRK